MPLLKCLNEHVLRNLAIGRVLLLLQRCQQLGSKRMYNWGIFPASNMSLWDVISARNDLQWGTVPHARRKSSWVVKITQPKPEDQLLEFVSPEASEP